MKAGSPGTDVRTVSKKDAVLIEKWEEFFNAKNPKNILVARYLYEHIFLGHLYFEDKGKPRFYQLVRSATPKPKKIIPINTVLPIGDPKKKFYYRFMPLADTIVDKNHIIYPMHQKKYNRIQKLFMQSNWRVTKLPSYGGKYENPFYTFKDIPAKIRYQFLLDNSHFFVNGFIKGPVCRGQVALDVIRDHFFVSMYTPESKFSLTDDKFYSEVYESLALPEDSESAYTQQRWRTYSDNVVRYEKEKEEFLKKVDKNNLGPSLKDIWDGDKTNKNAMLTIFRHFDNSTVVKGWQGQYPKTYWVLNYPLLREFTIF